jgi:high-affinity K+ transport system ATPase subunit B
VQLLDGHIDVHDLVGAVEKRVRRGISYKPLGAAAVLRRNLLIYGVGGAVLPFAGIKVIDVVLVAVGLA